MFVFLTFALVAQAAAQQMSLCDYYEKLGLAKAECGHIIRPPTMNAWSTPIRTFNTYGFNSFANTKSDNYGTALPLCRNYFHSCMSSAICESGTVCTSGTGGGSCCTSPDRASCPSITELNISCRKLRSVNWCNSDVDCRGASTTASMCCPTGCNYNMCIHVGPQNMPTRRNLVFSSLSNENTCPDPYRLDIKCAAHRTTNWCNVDAECRSGLYARKCCPTLCGYNACVMHFNGKWIVA